MGRNMEKVDTTFAKAAASSYWSESEARAVLKKYDAIGLLVTEFARRHGLRVDPKSAGEDLKRRGASPDILRQRGSILPDGA